MSLLHTRCYALFAHAVLAALAGAASSAGAALPNWFGIWEVHVLHVNGSVPPDDPPGQIRPRCGGHPPYPPEAEARFKEYVQKLSEMPDESFCLFGFPNVMLESPLFFEVLIPPQETAMVFSAR